MLYNKTLDVKDYDNIKPEEAHINHMKYILSNTLYSFEHKHRMWEYGLVLKALRENKVKTVLDVGGGASIFAPACAFAGAEVIQVDKEDREKWVQQQNAVLPKKIKYIKEDFLNFGFYGKFDAVTAISVLEHVELDEVFFRKLLRFVNPMGIAAITVDFHPDGKPKVKEHLRTYNAVKMSRLINMAEDQGFNLLGGRFANYQWNGPEVNEYTFASLVMRKEYGQNNTGN